MNQMNGEWNVERVHALYPLDVSREILKIEIISTLQPNKITWAHEKIGVFTIKSTYRSILREKKFSLWGVICIDRDYYSILKNILEATHP